MRPADPPSTPPSTPAPPRRSKIFVSLLAGAATGVVGVTGVKGFLVYLLAHAAMAGLLLLKAAPQPQRFFASS